MSAENYRKRSKVMLILEILLYFLIMGCIVLVSLI